MGSRDLIVMTPPPPFPRKKEEEEILLIHLPMQYILKSRRRLTGRTRIRSYSRWARRLTMAGISFISSAAVCRIDSFTLSAHMDTANKITGVVIFKLRISELRRHFRSEGEYEY